MGQARRNDAERRRSIPAKGLAGGERNRTGDAAGTRKFETEGLISAKPFAPEWQAAQDPEACGELARGLGRRGALKRERGPRRKRRADNAAGERTRGAAKGGRIE